MFGNLGGDLFTGDGLESGGEQGPDPVGYYLLGGGRLREHRDARGLSRLQQEFLGCRECPVDETHAEVAAGTRLGGAGDGEVAPLTGREQQRHGVTGGHLELIGRTCVDGHLARTNRRFTDCDRIRVESVVRPVATDRRTTGETSGLGSQRLAVIEDHHVGDQHLRGGHHDAGDVLDSAGEFRRYRQHFTRALELRREVSSCRTHSDVGLVLLDERVQ